jgi:hypothetical protein
MRHRWSYVFAVAAVIAAALATPSFAECGAGAFRLDQSGVGKGGVTPGDAKGFPVTITTSGSYCLTSNLDVAATTSSLDVSAIELVGSNLEVTIDLNGFTIRGPYVPFGPEGTGGGVSWIDGSNHLDMRNGKVLGFTTCVAISHGSAENLHVESCSQGLFIETGIARRIVAEGNADDGIFVGKGTVDDSYAASNGGSGIHVANNGIVRNSVAAYNELDGIRMNSGVATGNHTFYNGGLSFVEFNCTGTCAYSLNNFDLCSAGPGTPACVVGSGAVQTPAGSNVCGGGVCP